MSSTVALLDANKLATDRPEIAFAFSHADTLFLLHLVHQLGEADLDHVVSMIPLPRERVVALVDRLVDARLLLRRGVKVVLPQAVQRRLEYGTASLEFLVGLTLSPQMDVPHPLHFEYKIKDL